MWDSFLPTALLAFAVMSVCGFLGLPLLRHWNARQEVREEGPQSHRSKAGTPTMGGLLMAAALVITLAIGGHVTAQVGWLLFLVLGHVLLGFVDDGIKAVYKRNLGLTAKQKLAGQLVLAAIFTYGLVAQLGMPTMLHIPFFGWEWPLGYGYWFFAALVIVGTTNAVNLTDGLDGLAAGTSAIAAMAFVWVAAAVNAPVAAEFAAAVAGVCLGFLLFNYHPAKVFMGDTGSLALGAAFAGLALLLRAELLLVIIGGVFVAEAVSVILQVGSFKLRGKRIFRMSPLHHHFELGGMPEVRVVHVFWLAGAVLAILGICVR